LSLIMRDLPSRWILKIVDVPRHSFSFSMDLFCCMLICSSVVMKQSEICRLCWQRDISTGDSL
jgi:hypothetical protein